MTNPSTEQIEAAAEALYELEPWRAPSDRYHHTGSSVYLWDELSEEDQENYQATARAALVAAAGVTPVQPSSAVDVEKVIDALVMTDLSDYAGTDMGMIRSAARAVVEAIGGESRG